MITKDEKIAQYIREVYVDRLQITLSSFSNEAQYIVTPMFQYYELKAILVNLPRL